MGEIRIDNMSDKTKLYVFEKKEIALIFVFMLLIATTAFMLGVRIGKNYSYDASGLTSEDRERVELLSTQEEMIRKILESEEVEDIDEDQLNREMHDVLRDRIRRQLEEAREREDRSSVAPERPRQREVISDYRSEDLSPPSQPLEEISTDQVELRTASSFSGKFTIQLGSYRSLNDAEDFARGFAVRGYDPIINEVEIPSRGGTWYRVSLGLFDSATQAKNYIEQERELFQGQEHVIRRFD